MSAVSASSPGRAPSKISECSSIFVHFRTTTYNQAKTNYNQAKTKYNQVQPSKTKDNQVQPSRNQAKTKYNQVQPSTTKYNQVRPSTTKYDQVQPSTTKYNEAKTKYSQAKTRYNRPSTTRYSEVQPTKNQVQPSTTNYNHASNIFFHALALSVPLLPRSNTPWADGPANYLRGRFGLFRFDSANTTGFASNEGTHPPALPSHKRRAGRLYF